jgi:hypothetical protein
MSIIGLSMAVLPCRAEEDVEAGSAALRVDWPIYPRHTEDGRDCASGPPAKILVVVLAPRLWPIGELVRPAELGWMHALA